MVKYIIVIVVIFLGLSQGAAQVQSLGDSVPLFGKDFSSRVQEQRLKRTLSDSVYFYTGNALKRAFLQNNIAQIIGDSLQQASVLQIQYGSEKGGAKLPVRPYQSQNAGIYTEGFITLGKLKLKGDFYFDRIWDDSLANNLAGDLKNGAPFTLFAAKAGAFERQHVKAAIGAGYPVTKQLFLTTELKYDYQWSAGSIDPRPLEKQFNLQLAPGVTYQLGRTNLGAAYIFGKTDGAYGVSYKSKPFLQGELYPERRMYINNGYGFSAKYSSAPFNEARSVISGWELSAKTNLNGWNVGFVYSNVSDAKRNFNLFSRSDTIRQESGKVIYTNSRVEEAIHSRYELITQKINLFINRESAFLQHSFSVDGYINEGTAELTQTVAGANYLFDEHVLKANYLLSIKKNGAIKTELMIGGELQHFTKKDFMAQHFYENTGLNLGIGAGKYFKHSVNMLKVFLKPMLAIPLKNDLSVPSTQVSAYTKTVVYPEYSFRGSSFLTGTFSAEYYMPMLLRFAGSSFFAEGSLLKRVKNAAHNNVDFPADVIAGERFNFNAGFKLFL